ncbi:hypothetical protein HNP72_002698 [Sphingobacterium soli]|nr:hypothetical protein [Sphingobacterium soli]
MLSLMFWKDGLRKSESKNNINIHFLTLLASLISLMSKILLINELKLFIGYSFN